MEGGQGWIDRQEEGERKRRRGAKMKREKKGGWDRHRVSECRLTIEGEGGFTPLTGRKEGKRASLKGRIGNNLLRIKRRKEGRKEEEEVLSFRWKCQQNRFCLSKFHSSSNLNHKQKYSELQFYWPAVQTGSEKALHK